MSQEINEFRTRVRNETPEKCFACGEPAQGDNTTIMTMPGFQEEGICSGCRFPDERQPEQP